MKNSKTASKNEIISNNSRLFNSNLSANGLSKETKDEIFRNNLGLIEKITSKYISKNPSLDRDDIYQESSIALYKAIDNFNGNIKTFASYASEYIDGYIKNFINKDSSVKVSQYYSKKIKDSLAFQESLEKDLYSLNSLEFSIDSDDKKFLSKPKVDYISALEYDNSTFEIAHDDDFFENIIHNEDRDILLKAFGCLSMPEKDLISTYYGIDREQKNFQEIGDEEGITRQGVKSKHDKILDKIKKEIFFK